MTKIITREVIKLIMFTIAWAIPILSAKMFENTHFLWLFILSAIITVAVFSHYEDLEKLEHSFYSIDEDDENVDYDE